ncbi:MAG: YdcF family protein [Lentilitoribacter sp.]
MSIYLHKILPILVSPLVLIIAVLLLAVWWKRRRLVLLAIISLWVMSIPITGKFLMAQLENGMVLKQVSSMPQVDAIVVLSGILTTVEGEGGLQTEWLDPDRYFGGIALFNAGKAPKLIFTRGQLPWTNQSVPEGDYLKAKAIEDGVPEAAILLTDIVENTEDEAIATRNLFNVPNEPKILLVTSAFHMPRASDVFQSQGMDVTPYPVDFKVRAEKTTVMSYLPTANALSQTSLYVREMLGRVYYRVKNAL